MGNAVSQGSERYFEALSEQRAETLRGRLERAAENSQAHEQISRTLESADAALVERIHALGFDGDSARVFDLLPLVFISWADGKVQRAERRTIASLLERRGIEPESDAAALIVTLLDAPPPQAFVKEALRVLGALLGEGARGQEVVEYCVQVAEASGGLLGFGNKVDAREADAIRRVAEGLGEEALAAFSHTLS